MTASGMNVIIFYLGLIFVVGLSINHRLGKLTKLLSPVAYSNNTPIAGEAATLPRRMGPRRVEGERVLATTSAGFHVGAVGTVVFQEPSGHRCWVLRDGTSSPCYFYNYELESE